MDSFSLIGVILVGGFAALMFCLGLALVGLVVGRVELEKRKADALEQERRHKERLRALELGFPLPEAELAHAQADGRRAVAAGIVGFFVPLGLGGLAVGATAIILDHLPAYNLDPMHLPPVLYALWGVVGLVSIVTVTMCLLALRRGNSSPAQVRRPRQSERLEEALPADR